MKDPRVDALLTRIEALEREIARLREGNQLKAGLGITIQNNQISLSNPIKEIPQPTGLNQVLMSRYGFAEWVSTTPCPT